MRCFLPNGRLFHLLAITIATVTTSFAQIINPGPAGLIEHGAGVPPYIAEPNGVQVRGNYAYISSAMTHALEIVDITLPSAPFHKGSLTSSDNRLMTRSRGLAVSGNYAYVLSGDNNALLVIDISNPSAPVVKGATFFELNFLTYGGSVFVKGNYAFVTSASTSTDITDHDLFVVDVSDPTNPVQLTSSGSVPDIGLTFLPKAVFVSGKYAYVINYSQSLLKVVDITNPNVPVITGSLADGQGGAVMGGPQALFVKDSTVFITSRGSNALEIATVTNGVPTHKGSLFNGSGGALLFEPFSIKVKDTLAYIGAHGNDALEIVNIKNPALPKHVASLSNGSGGALLLKPIAVDVSGDFAYIMSETGDAMEIINVNKPDTPAHRATLKSGTGGPLLNIPRSMAIKGDYGYVVSLFSNSLEILNIKDPQKPTHVSSLVHNEKGAYLNGPVGIAISGDYALIVNTSNAVGTDALLQVVDISDPSNPKPVGRLNSANAGYSIAVSGSKAFIITRVGGIMTITAVDISTVTSPVELGSATSAFGISTFLNSFGKYPLITISGNYAYVTGGSSLTIVDITTSPNPTIKSRLTNGTGGAKLAGASSVAVSGNYAYVASYSSNALEVVNVSNPAAPVHAGSFSDLNYLNGPICVALSGNYAYVGNYAGSSLELVDISTPTNPKHYRHLNNGENGTMMAIPNAIVASGPYAYVLNNSSSVQVIYMFSPNILSFDPPTGAGNTSVTIEGENLDSFLKVNFNGAYGEVLSVDGTTAVVKVPSGAKVGKIAIEDHSVPISSAGNFLVIPNTLPSSNMRQDGFVANWTDVGATTYFIDVSTDGFETFVEGYENHDVGSDPSFDVGGLTSGTSYQYRVRSSDGSEVSNNSNSGNSITLPATPVAVNATAVEQTGFTANWDPVPGAAGYYIDIATSGEFKSFLIGAENLSVTSNSFNATRLDAFKEYHYRVRAFNASGVSPNSNVISVNTADNVAPQISAPSFPNPTSVTQGNTPTLNMSITDNVIVKTAKLFYRGISKKEFTITDMQGPGGVGGNYSVVIQTTWYDSLGLEYYVQARDAAGNESVTPSSYVQLISPSLSLAALPSGPDVASYRIVSFPYKLVSDNKVTTVYSNVPWNDFTKASMWWWNPSANSSNGGYDRFGIAPEFQTIEPGKGYWVITREPMTPQLTNVPASPYNRNNLFVMSLKPGWNQIGNPYPVAISWDDVIAFNHKQFPSASFSGLTIYDGNSLREADGSLKAFEGGFVKNLGSTEIAIQIPFPGQVSGSGRKSSAIPDLSQDNWNIFLHLQQNDFTNKLGGVGMNKNADIGEDRYDDFNPPELINFPGINFGMSDISNNIVGSQRNYVWKFKPRGRSGETMKISWNSEFIIGSTNLLLLDEEDLVVIDMSQEDSYSFTMTDTRSFKIFYGDNINIATETIAAGKIFPNPLANQSAHIRLSLPESGAATVQLFDLQGRVVYRRAMTLTAGIHEVNVGGESLSEGVYIYKLAVVSENSQKSFTGKLVKQ